MSNRNIQNIIHLYNFESSPAQIPYSASHLIFVFTANVTLMALITKYLVIQNLASPKLQISIWSLSFVIISSELIEMFVYNLTLKRLNLGNRFVQFATALISVQLASKIAIITLIIISFKISKAQAILQLLSLSILLWQIAVRLYVIRVSFNIGHIKALTLFVMANMVAMAPQLII